MGRSRGGRPPGRIAGRVPLAIVLLAVALGPRAAFAAAPPPQVQLLSKQVIPILTNQGIAHIRDGWILSGTDSPIPGTDALVRTDEQFNVVVRSAPAIPPEWRARGYDHIGDIDVVGDAVYVPFEEPDYSKGRQATARYDVRTLRFIDAVELPQHENSFVTVDPATRIAYTMDHFDGDALLRYDVAHGWKPLAPLRLSTLLRQTQGASVSDGAVWICTSDEHNDLYRVDLRTGHVDTIGQITDPPGEGEGIDVTRLRSGRIHALVIDPDKTKVWVEHFSFATPTTATTASRVGKDSSTDVGGVAAWVAGAVAFVGVVLWLARRRMIRRREPASTRAQS